jgi:hypothetical protein
VKVTVTLTDKYGNPVSVNGAANSANPGVVIAYNGPGLLVGNGVGAITQSTDADGQVSFSVILGANDSGTATVTATYNESGNTTAAADVITVQKTIIIGAAPAAEARGWTKDMGDGTIKMYARDVVGAGKIQFFHNGREVAWIRAVDATDPKLNVASDGMVRTRALVSGKNVFEIYVDGERIVRRIATGS